MHLEEDATLGSNRRYGHLFLDLLYFVFHLSSFIWRAIFFYAIRLYFATVDALLYTWCLMHNICLYVCLLNVFSYGSCWVSSLMYPTCLGLKRVVFVVFIVIWIMNCHLIDRGRSTFVTPMCFFDRNIPICRWNHAKDKVSASIEKVNVLVIHFPLTFLIFVPGKPVV